MLYKHWKLLPIWRVFITLLIILSQRVTIVGAQVKDLQESSEAIKKVPSVSELSDVKPTDWAYRALQSIIERYGCISGYPDETFRGNRVLNRYEFASALNACIMTMSQMVEKKRANFATTEELEVLQKLQQEFKQELTKLPSKLDRLQGKIEQLEARPSFSTTSQLLGRAIFGVSTVAGNDVEDSIVFSHRSQLTIDTSFAGRDRLRIRLSARNTPRFNRVADTDMANLSFAGDNRNILQLTQVSYRFRPSKQLQATIAAYGGSFTNFTNSLNSPISSSAIGSISKFGEESAIYDLGGNVGAGIEYRFSDEVRLSLGYMAAGRPNNQEQGIGGGAYGAIAQLTLEPTESLSLGLTYVRAYNTLDTRKGSDFANKPFDEAATSANAYGIQTSWKLNQDLTFSSWVALIDATAESEPYKGAKASILTWATTLAINDIGGEGNTLGLVFGQPPKTIKNDVTAREDSDTALHFEAFYRYRLTDNLYITPGFFVIFNPEHNAANDPVYVGTIRKTFLF
jgi:Carbohydrate-selective porin, OprB family/S-layer homology domain